MWCTYASRVYLLDISAASGTSSLPRYLAIAIVAVCGTAVVVILIFMLCYVLAVWKYRKRYSQGNDLHYKYIRSSWGQKSTGVTQEDFL